MKLTAKEAFDKCMNQTKRIPEFEGIIATSAWYSYWYALWIINGRFLLGEPIIATNTYYSYWYAIDIIKGRFELGEKLILNSKYAEEYKRKFLT